MAVRTNLVAVKGPQVAAVFGGSGSEGLPGSGNPVDRLKPHTGTAAPAVAQLPSRGRPRKL